MMITVVFLFFIDLSSPVALHEKLYEHSQRTRRYSYRNQNQPYPAFLNSPMSMSYPGTGSSPMTSQSGQCIMDDIVCPAYCIMEDEWGCKYCPCGPANGMSPPVVNPHSEPHDVKHEDHECLGTILCMLSCKEGYKLGPKQESGCQSCTCVKKNETNNTTDRTTMKIESNHTSSQPCAWPLCMGASAPNSGPGSGSSMTSLPIGGSAGFGGSMPGVDCMGPACSAKNGMHTMTMQSPAVPLTQVTPRPPPMATPVPPQHIPTPQHNCPRTDRCKQSCDGVVKLGPKGADGCEACLCVRPATKAPEIVYLIPATPAPRICEEVERCRKLCQYGFEVENSQREECPRCHCLRTPRTPLPTVKTDITTVLRVCPEAVHCMSTCTTGYTLTSEHGSDCPVCMCNREPKIILLCERPLSCQTGCTVGYKCDVEGCPTCSCVTPSETSLHVQVHNPVIGAALDCNPRFSCVDKCTFGYKTGKNGCPTCVCLQPVTVKIQTHEEVERPITRELITNIGGNAPLYVTGVDTNGCIGPACSAIHAIQPGMQGEITTGNSGDYPHCIGAQCPVVNVGTNTLGLTVPNSANYVLPTRQSPLCDQPLSCPMGCTVGYKCDKKGCPTCTCIVPTETTYQIHVQSIIVHESLSCSFDLPCRNRCTFGYRTGTDNCPICNCLEPVTDGNVSYHGNIQAPVPVTRLPGMHTGFNQPVTQMPIPPIIAPSGLGCLGPSCPTAHELGQNGNTFFSAIDYQDKFLSGVTIPTSNRPPVMHQVVPNPEPQQNVLISQGSGLGVVTGVASNGALDAANGGAPNVVHIVNGDGSLTSGMQRIDHVIPVQHPGLGVSGVVDGGSGVVDGVVDSPPRIYKPGVPAPQTPTTGPHVHSGSAGTVQWLQEKIPIGSQISGVHSAKDECPAAVKCMVECEGAYNLSRVAGSICPDCTCVPNSEAVKPIEVPLEISTPSPGQCVAILHCVMTCNTGYDIGDYGKNGCPSCTCLD